MTDTPNRVGLPSRSTESLDPVARTDGRTDRTNEETNYDELSFSPNASRAGGQDDSSPLGTIHSLGERGTWVYHLFCSHGMPIYVGVADDLTRRLKQHRASKDWWSDAECVIADLYPTRRQALDVEAHYLRHGYDVQLHNIQGRPSAKPLPHKWSRRQDFTIVKGRPIQARYYVGPDQRMRYHGSDKVVGA